MCGFQALVQQLNSRTPEAKSSHEMEEEEKQTETGLTELANITNREFKTFFSSYCMIDSGKGVEFLQRSEYCMGRVYHRLVSGSWGNSD